MAEEALFLELVVSVLRLLVVVLVRSVPLVWELDVAAGQSRQMGHCPAVADVVAEAVLELAGFCAG